MSIATAPVRSTGDIIRVSEVWQSDADRRPSDPRNCLRGLIVRHTAQGIIRPRCTGVNCLHD